MPTSQGEPSGCGPTTARSPPRSTRPCARPAPRHSSATPVGGVLLDEAAPIELHALDGQREVRALPTDLRPADEAQRLPHVLRAGQSSRAEVPDPPQHARGRVESAVALAMGRVGEVEERRGLFVDAEAAGAPCAAVDPAGEAVLAGSGSISAPGGRSRRAPDPRRGTPARARSSPRDGARRGCPWRGSGSVLVAGCPWRPALEAEVHGDRAEMEPDQSGRCSYSPSVSRPKWPSCM